MTEQSQNKALALRAGAPVQAIVPQTMEDAYRIATAVIAAGMAPKGLETQEKCLIAIMQGAEVGMTPLQSIQRIAVINGRPTIWGDAAIGLVRGSGLCEYIKEWIEGEGDNMVAYCEAKRKGENQPIRSSFSVADAKAAGLLNKAGPWIQYRKRMLQMRARGFTMRDGFADVLGGMYIREEMEGVQPASHTRSTNPIADQAIDPPAPPPAPEPEIEDAQFEEQPAEPPRPEPQQEPPQSSGRFVAPDDFLDGLEAEFASAPDFDTLNEIWANAQEELTGVFPPDRDKAREMYDRHAKRLGQ